MSELDVLEGRALLEAIGKLATNPGAVERQLARWDHQVKVAEAQRQAAKARKARRAPGVYTEQWPKMPPSKPSRWIPAAPCPHCKPTEPCLAHADY